MIFSLSDEFTINEINFRKAFLKPSSITWFLSKLISNGFDISIPYISKAFALTLVVEKKNIIRARPIKKICPYLYYKLKIKLKNLIFNLIF